MKKTLLSLLCLAALGSASAVAATVSLESPLAACGEGCGKNKEKKTDDASACGDHKKEGDKKDASACGDEKHKKGDKSE